MRIPMNKLYTHQSHFTFTFCYWTILFSYILVLYPFSFKSSCRPKKFFISFYIYCVCLCTLSCYASSLCGLWYEIERNKRAGDDCGWWHFKLCWFGSCSIGGVLSILFLITKVYWYFGTTYIKSVVFFKYFHCHSGLFKIRAKPVEWQTSSYKYCRSGL